MLSSYLENPINCFFEGQDHDENILLLLRAHPVTNLSWIIPSLLLFLLPYFWPFIVEMLNIQFPPIPQNLVNVLILVNYLIVLVVTFEGFLHWYFNVYILTNKKIVDIDFHSLMFKNVDLAPLSQIQEANSQMAGLLGIIFHYGDVFIQTAGAKVAIDFHQVPNPHKVADKIMDEVLRVGGKGAG